MNKKVLRISFFALNVLIIGLFFYLPYYLFDGRLFLGGDDTRLYYAYPSELLKYLASYSWITISSLPSNIPNFHAIPFLLVSVLLDTIFQSKTYLFNFFFSLPFVLGFIYFQKCIRELLGKEYILSLATSLIYVLSPITIVSHFSHFLTPVWLVALLPIIAYHYVRYIRYGTRRDIIFAVLWSIFLSMAYFAIVWLLGAIIPLVCGAMFLIIVGINPFKKIVKRTIVFVSYIFSSQLFWLVPFFMSMTYKGETDLGGKVISKTLSDSFSPTVLSTATGNIIYPLLTFYHKQIAVDYNWLIKDVFISYWDHISPLSMIYAIVLFLGIITYRQTIKGEMKVLFLFVLSAFLFALYFFTVNIGFLRSLFLLFGHIPGFSIFRNFTDKFSLGYIFIYSVLLSFCLHIIKKSIPKLFAPTIFLVIVITLINFLPVKQVINSPVWTTKHIYQTVNLPTEYFEFAEKIQSIVPNTSNVFSLPQNIASYAVIVESNRNNAYIGTSPFKFFTGINDLSGSMSYPEEISNSIRESIVTRNYEKLLTTLHQINVGYVLITNNIPDEITHSYLFDIHYLKFQNNELLDSITESETLRSANGTYVLYTMKKPMAVFLPPENIEFRKISPVKYEVKINNIKESQELLLKETYHPGWRVYLSEKQKSTVTRHDLLDLKYFFKPSFFDLSHKRSISYGNTWTIDTNTVLHDSTISSYEKNADGTVNIYLTLFFFPQLYFYIGIISTVLIVSILSLYIQL